jgi:Effector Associated Constant Component 1
MTTELFLDVSEDDADDLRLEELALQLRAELLETDIDAVEPATSGETPDGTRSAMALATGALVASLTPGKIVSVVGTIVGWLRNSRGPQERKVRIEIDGDVIDVTGADDETEKRLVDAFIQRHTSAPPTT